MVLAHDASIFDQVEQPAPAPQRFARWFRHAGHAQLPTQVASLDAVTEDKPDCSAVPV